jgi:hypothetical protein
VIVPASVLKGMEVNSCRQEVARVCILRGNYKEPNHIEIMQYQYSASTQYWKTVTKQFCILAGKQTV